ncbi:MAG: ATP--guanido phosphotransferase [Elusimicrobia bacterium]|nr:ATP--guanido phosphotransferase [Elusimicrobiota bacterium]
MNLQGMLPCRMGWVQAEGPSADVVLASRVRLARNLAAVQFPGRAKAAALKAAREQVFAAARRTTLKGAAYLELDGLDDVDLRFLAERHLISPALAGRAGQGGAVVDPRECLNLMINEEDHLRLFALAPGLDLRRAARTAGGLDDELSQSLDFAFRRDWGYLTACPTNLGTGMRASALMHLAGLGLAGLINTLLETLPRAGLIARGLYGEGTKVMGDFFQISNATALGRTEAELAAAVESAAEALVRREKDARQKLAAGPDRARIEDTVYRAIGVLTGARLLSFEESCRHLSALRLGLSLGWAVPGDFATVNELMILTQPAHLAMLAGKPLVEEDQAALRASLVRRRLTGK